MNAINGRRKVKADEYEFDYKMKKEHGRWQLTFLHNMLSDKKDQVTDPKKLITFSWEQEHQQSTTITQEAKEALLRRIERFN